ncbi:hypothetical protein COU17_01880 [Candidatus Kaiserbacteria bacterium CG10_big_fil_rev_8_21_14_0_10_49_17]|uniref:Uncharacterized protein n=1 Tax=Candidatus Kaiserbacteria bacterium CG10_big_fil_rev_8_21_14_0_10_49_17 TaxID=1974609 RepID=A0A2M6WEH6_9BACT|nr:MAG: hypothetical protein COU17_01880 [Candidatus Kaiserbacteria bacterium CG10_big_fil_rev_8_21_14_0_10_49_17]
MDNSTVTAGEMQTLVSAHFNNPENREDIIRDCVFYQSMKFRKKTNGAVALLPEDRKYKEQKDFDLNCAVEGADIRVVHGRFYPAKYPHSDTQMEVSVMVNDCRLLGQFLCTLTEEGRIELFPDVPRDFRHRLPAFRKRFEEKPRYAIEA